MGIYTEFENAIQYPLSSNIKFNIYSRDGNCYGEKLVEALVSTGYELIIRPHPQSYTADKSVRNNLQILQLNACSP